MTFDSNVEYNKQIHIKYTVEPLLSGPPLSGHTLLNGQLSKSRKYLLYINKETTSIQRPPLLSGRGHLPTVPNQWRSQGDCFGGASNERRRREAFYGGPGACSPGKF